MTNLDSVLKSKDITLPTKVHIVKAIVFPVVKYRDVNWIYAEELMLLNCGDEGDSRESLGHQGGETRQSWFQRNNPEYSLGGLMWKLKLQYFGHLMQRANSLKRP